ncbi:MAG: RnfABCDGE type electron transport complex subunit D [Eubacteriales bacterium]|nr:RnfABCDGE type electron transport complex subunit D [Eubacteriales bacterium]
MSDKFLTGPSPHILGGKSVSSIMWDVVIALIPVSLISILYFGLKALTLLVVSMASAMIIEGVFMAIRHKGLKSAGVIRDGSAAVTGLLVALIMPPAAPLWLVVIANAVAILLAKQAYGGIGNNIFNPALAARAFVFMAWPAIMTTWSTPLGLDNWFADLITGATPLGGADNTLLEMFLGNTGGCLGETSALAIIIGGLYLLLKGHIDWRIPVGYLGAAAFFAFFSSQFSIQDVAFNLLAGGLLFGAVFMATDMVTSPTTKNGRLIFGIGCGLITIFVRKFASAPEGVTYAILFMNALVPLIDRFTVPKTFGEVKVS